MVADLFDVATSGRQARRDVGRMAIDVVVGNGFTARGGGHGHGLLGGGGEAGGGGGPLGDGGDGHVQGGGSRRLVGLVDDALVLGERYEAVGGDRGGDGAGTHGRRELLVKHTRARHQKTGSRARARANVNRDDGQVFATMKGLAR